MKCKTMVSVAVKIYSQYTQPEHTQPEHTQPEHTQHLAAIHAKRPPRGVAAEGGQCAYGGAVTSMAPPGRRPSSLAHSAAMAAWNFQ